MPQLWTSVVLLCTLPYAAALSLTSSVEEAGRHAACPGEEVVFTCSVTQSFILQWDSDSFQEVGYSIRFTAGSTSQVGQPIPRGEFQAVLTSLTNISGQLADMTSTLTVVANDPLFLNGTVVNCTTLTDFTEQGVLTESKRLHIAAPPSPPRSPSHILQSHTDDSATVSVRWEQPESDGWARIERFNITVTGMTISASGSNTMVVLPTSLPYNQEITVLITASNCAGESSNVELTFTIVSCGDPDPPSRGELQAYDSTLEGSEVFYHCNEGLAPEERMTTTCGADGNWSPNPAELVCSADCGPPQPPSNGVVQSHSSTVEGSVVVYQCSTGFVPEEEMMAVCTTEGRWVPNPTELNCLADCGTPVPPRNGSVTTITGTTQGSEAVYVCDAGLVPSQQMTAVCREDRVWDPNPASLTCLADCGYPSPPINGFLLSYNSTLEGSMVVFRCEEGFLPEGNITGLCAENGSWTPDPTTFNCMELTPGTEPDSASGSGSNIGVTVAVVTVFVILAATAVIAVVLGVLYLKKYRRKYSLSQSQPTTRNGTDMEMYNVEDRDFKPMHHPTGETYADGDRPHLNDDTHVLKYSSLLSSELVHSADKELNLDSVLLQLREIHNYWYQLGEALGIPTFILDEVSFQALSSENSMQVTVDYWLRGHSGQPTWLEIAEALKEINLNHLSRSIRQVYITGSLPVVMDDLPPGEDVPPPIPARKGESPELSLPLPPKPGYSLSTSEETSEPPPIPPKGEGLNLASGVPPRSPKQPPRNRRPVELTTPIGTTKVGTGKAQAPPPKPMYDFAVKPNLAYHTVLHARTGGTASQEHEYETVLLPEAFALEPNPAYHTFLPTGTASQKHVYETIPGDTQYDSD